MTKQTSGIFVCLATIITPIIEKIYLSDNKNKKLIKAETQRICGILIPGLIFLIYLICTKSFGDFISYCVLGVKTFSNKIAYKNLFENDKAEIKIFSIINPIFVILMTLFIIVKLFTKDEEKQDIAKRRKEIEFLLYTFSLLILTFPISDEIHFLLGNYLVILLEIFEIDTFLEESFDTIYLKNIKVGLEFIVLLGIIVYMINSGSDLYNTFKISKKEYELEDYKYLSQNEDVNQTIEKLKGLEDVSNKKIYILDANACIYHIPINEYYKNFDMFNNGNFGKDGTNGIIKQINENKGYYLIRNEEIESNWQTPQDVIKYIRENFSKVGDLGIYDIYIKN